MFHTSRAYATCGRAANPAQFQTVTGQSVLLTWQGVWGTPPEDLAIEICREDHVNEVTNKVSRTDWAQCLWKQLKQQMAMWADVLYSRVGGFRRAVHADVEAARNHPLASAWLVYATVSTKAFANRRLCFQRKRAAQLWFQNPTQSRCVGSVGWLLLHCSA